MLEFSQSEHALEYSRKSMVQIWSAAVSLMLIAASGDPLTAAETIFTRRAEFEASLGTFRVITFEAEQGFSLGLLPSFDSGRIETRSELGSYFGPASIISYADSSNRVLVGQEEVGPHPNSNVRLLFSDPQFAIGFDSIGAGETVVVDFVYVDSSTSQHIFDPNDQQHGAFFGLRSDVGFRDVFIMGANRGDPDNPGEQPNHIDNLTLIPEPWSAALAIAAGLNLLLYQRGAIRRRQARHRDARRVTAAPRRC